MAQSITIKHEHESLNSGHRLLAFLGLGIPMHAEILTMVKVMLRIITLALAGLGLVRV
jgi:hypothetical protein